MIAAPMPSFRRSGSRFAAAQRNRRRSIAAVLLTAAAALAACGSPAQTGTPVPTLASESPTPTPSPTASPTPTPLPTPQYTNPADPALAALIPTEVAGATVQVPAVDEFAYTPGDFGEAYGELGLRFTALQVAYVPRPRSLSLFVARVSPPAVTTAELEPHLATAGRYVGIDGLHREPWELETIDGRLVWVRPEDHATALNTMIYTWASGEYVFLMIGVDDELNRAMFAALPGEAAPTPSPAPSSASQAPSGEPTGSPAAS